MIHAHGVSYSLTWLIITLVKAKLVSVGARPRIHRPNQSYVRETIIAARIPPRGRPTELVQRTELDQCPEILLERIAVDRG